jgi:hypothetical protein
MKVNSKITINTQKIKQLTRAQITALEQTGEALHTEVVQAQVMPRDKGTLQNESTFVDYSESSNGKVTLVSSTPYARRLYFHPEYDFKTDENPNAKAHWYDDWINGDRKEFCKKAYKEFYKRAGGL